MKNDAVTRMIKQPQPCIEQPQPCMFVADGGRRPAGRRPGLWLLVLMAGVFAVVLGCPAVSTAAITHKYLYQITGFTPGVETAFAFDAAEDVYVTDENARVVERFAPGGAASPFECGTTQCEEYLKGNEILGTPTGAGGALAPFAKPAGVAVDQATGEVYVSDRRSGVVDVFAKTGEYLGRLEGVCENPGEMVGAGLCVKGRKNAKGEEETTFKAFHGPLGLAFDQASDDLYIDDGSVVDVVSTSDELVLTFGEGKAGEEGVLSGSGLSGSVAVNEASGDAYVGSEEDVVDVFEESGGFVKPAWGGKGTRGGSFGAGGLSVGIDHASGHVFVGENTHDVVDEFESSTVEEYVTQLTGTPSGGFGEVEGVGVGGGGDVFVAAGGVVDVFGPDVTIPDVSVVEPPSGLTRESAVLRGVVDADGAGEASCEFEYGTSSAYGSRVPCVPERISGSGPVGVEAGVDGLAADTTYFYRVVAANGNGVNLGQGVEDEGEFTTMGPGIREESVGDVASGSVTLQAAIDPHNGVSSPSAGARESYYFQYSQGSVEGCGVGGGSCVSVPVAPGAALPEGDEGVVDVGVHVQGLSSGTLYHYRVVVISEPDPKGEPGRVEAFEGADQEFVTQAAGGFVLADGRRWELVSPPEKHGALIYPIREEGLVQAAAGGDALTYNANQPTEVEPEGSSNEVQIYSAREAGGGWLTRDIELPHSSVTAKPEQVGEQYRFFSEDLSQAVVDPSGLFDAGLSAGASEQTAFLRTDFVNGNVDEPCVPKSMGCYTPLVSGCPGEGRPCPAAVQALADVPAGTVFGQTGVFGACPPSPFCGPLFADATPDASHVVLDSAVALTARTNLGDMYEWSGGRLQPLYLLPDGEGGVGVALGSEAQEEPGSADHQITDGGSVFEYGKHLYVHEFGSEASLRVDAAQGVSEPAEGDASFLYASSDGSRVFFYDPLRLTGAAGGGVYECRLSGLSCELTLTGLEGGGLLGGSQDGSYLYFQAGGRLIVDHDDGVSWTSTTGPFIGTQSLGETHRVSPNGLFLAFMSSEQLTGYDNHDANSGQPDEEVYLYSAATNQLVCASCDPTGARPIGEEYGLKPKLVGGNRVWPEATWLAANVPGWTAYSGRGNGVEAARYQSRYLSDSGRLFFNSRGGLVPQDVNGQWDVYEFEPVGVGSCSSGSSSGSVVYSPGEGGCVGLISSGTSAEESAFLDASETGGDVFFLTTSRLSPEDPDQAFDVYDAHECTAAAPCPAGVVGQPECVSVEECRAAPEPQPSFFGAPSSATFNGTGNLTPEPAPAGKAKVQSRAEKLAGALKACRKKKVKKERVACERQARSKYGPKPKAKAKAKAKAHKGKARR